MPNKKYRILLMGTSEFAVPSFLKIIKSNKFDVMGILTQPDKKIGRSHKVSYSPVKKIAIENNIIVFQPNSLLDKKIKSEISELNLDLILTAAYGKIIPRNILEIPRCKSVNIHPSLLPKYRGPSPIQCTILNGDKYSGTTIMLMNEKMDEGEILLQKKILLKNEYNAKTLQDKLAELSAGLIKTTLLRWTNNNIKPIKQNKTEATYSKIIKRENGRINWNNSQEHIYKKFRAYHPWPGIFTYLKIGNKKVLLKIIDVEINNNNNNYKYGTLFANDGDLRVATRDNKSIILKKVQLEGKKIINGREFIQGYNQILENKLI